ncbi:heparanase-like protein 3 [Helianthus annuus]|uniref:heparanase-like protein 3 n=1 Tax=Helianthus annuus TaxID=4232 RepID=UPI001652FEA1|nr:heparanase-like protein 3 [Helianthus annuus]
MGQKVLSVNFNGTNKIRLYAHCAKESEGITLLLINLDSKITVDVSLSLDSAWSLHKLNSHVHYHRHKSNKPRHSKISGTKTQEEYHLTAKDGDLHSQVIILNGKELGVNSNGEIPQFEPVNVDSSEPISVAPFSIVFAHIPNVTLYACGN